MLETLRRPFRPMLFQPSWARTSCSVASNMRSTMTESRGIDARRQRIVIVKRSKKRCNVSGWSSLPLSRTRTRGSPSPLPRL